MDNILKLQGKFITFEGGEGAGKSFCSKFLKSFFDKHNIPVTRTFDPGGCPTAQKIRHILLSKNSIITGKSNDKSTRCAECILPDCPKPLMPLSTVTPRTLLLSCK